MLVLARHFYLHVCILVYFSSIAGLFTFSGSGSLKLISVIFNLLGIVFGVILLFNPLMGIVFISTMIAITFVFVGCHFML